MSPNPQIYFAPFQGITTAVFRREFAKYFQGIDKFFTPYFSGSLFKQKSNRKILKALSEKEVNGIPLIPQILSKDADELIGFANYCRELGFKEVNWNLGCPHPQVADKKRGSGLLNHPKMIDEILQKAIPKLPIPLSIKCRLGYESVEEFHELSTIFNRFPLQEIILHARTGKQMYKGNANLDAFAKATAELKPNVVYNGDIFLKEDFARVTNQLPDQQTIMLGRGLLRNPFLAGSIKAINLTVDKKLHLRSFIENLYIAYRKENNKDLNMLKKLKEYWWYLAYSFDNPKAIERKIRKAKSFDAYEQSVSAVFDVFSIVV
jgi:tRNA-dihydrouridine synthase